MRGVYKDNKKIISRVKRIAAQLQGVEKMILSDTYYIDIIIAQEAEIKQMVEKLLM